MQTLAFVSVHLCRSREYHPVFWLSWSLVRDFHWRRKDFFAPNKKVFVVIVIKYISTEHGSEG